ncbi:putative flavin carrier protein 3 [Conoideocrella luteorostrata]|uniref:Flavin carrier protein 3 n=1 Tax=Conoideocrella luteorostrata TaxID=1105319 RepID=A0AAJ0FXC5_9HYPO|nr:putative flavin carrier protein 3 [Conoideocrella luteorostrata]
MLLSQSLNSCQRDSKFEASLFNVVYTPGNNSADIDIVATSSVQGKVVFDLTVVVYGLPIIQKVVNPCDIKGLDGICPMIPGKTKLLFNVPVSGDAVKDVPGIAFSIPDLDAMVRVKMNLSESNTQIACVEAHISNGKTVDLTGVKWATAIIAGLALLASGVVSGRGHLNTAAHVAANSLSLFGYFQAQAIIGLTGVHLPPIAQSWTQNFQWSMGIIHVTFMQKTFTWYQRATGGTPANIFSTLRSISVQVQKRSLEMVEPGVSLAKRALAVLPDAVTGSAARLLRRGNIQTESGAYVVYGIQRVAFRSKIETTNLFMTGLTFFCLFIIVTALGIAAFKGIIELCASKGMLAKDRFLEFRNGWRIILKGIMFRLCLIGFPQIAILCLWELTQIDSAAEAVLAVVFFFALSIILGWGTSKVIRIARRSIAMHRNPAYILFSDPQCLNKWGFLYIQFRASAYYFVVPVLGYILIKAMFVSFGQKAGLAQAIGFLILELAALIASSVLRPWMDKSTNSFNIAIYAVNFVNAIFLIIFSDVFGAPGIVVGVVGVVFFILNAAFSFILLLMVIISTAVTFFRKNPDARYQFMADDRASFMRSQTHLTTTTELDALAATARGDKGGYKSGLDLDDDVGHLHPGYGGNRSASPVSPSMPLFPASREQSPFRSASPAPSLGSHAGPPPSGYRKVNNSSPWKRGAGYE